MQSSRKREKKGTWKKEKENKQKIKQTEGEPKKRCILYLFLLFFFLFFLLFSFFGFFLFFSFFLFWLLFYFLSDLLLFSWILHISTCIDSFTFPFSLFHFFPFSFSLASKLFHFPFLSKFLFDFLSFSFSNPFFHKQSKQTNGKNLETPPPLPSVPAVPPPPFPYPPNRNHPRGRRARHYQQRGPAERDLCLQRNGYGVPPLVPRWLRPKCYKGGIRLLWSCHPFDFPLPDFGGWLSVLFSGCFPFLSFSSFSYLPSLPLLLSSPFFPFLSLPHS